MWDQHTRRSKSFGFVTFTKQSEAERAITELNGQMLGARRIRCGWAQHKLVRACVCVCPCVSSQGGRGLA